MPTKQQDPRAALRQTVDLMVSPDAAALAAFLACFQSRRLAKGEDFLRAGDAGTRLAFVHAGLLRFYYTTADGKEVNKSFASERQFAGALGAYLTGQPARFGIQALEDCELLVADMAEIAGLAERHRCWETFRRLVAEQLYLRKEEREAELLLDSAETRYRRFLHRYPGLEGRIPQYHVAGYLGITPVALSRIRQRMKMRTA